MKPNESQLINRPLNRGNSSSETTQRIFDGFVVLVFLIPMRGSEISDAQLEWMAVLVSDPHEG